MSQNVRDPSGPLLRACRGARAWPLAALLCCLLLPVPGQGQDVSHDPSKRLQAVRIDSPIRIDGSLQEAVWQQAPSINGFVQSEPYEGRPATEDSEVRILFDQRNLYVGIVCRDREPGKIVANALKRDFDPREGDSFEIILDTFNDQRTGFLFVTNPHGAQADAQLGSDGRDFSENWNGVWEAKSKINEDGWSSEIVIPFKTLRFPETGAGSWRINFLRRIRRKNEIDSWFLIPRRYLSQLTNTKNSYRVSLSGELAGLEGMKQGRNLKVKPFFLADLSKISSRGASSDGDVDGGVDVKYGLTSDLTLDVTYNTDFSQVEADEQQINLTRFPLFFPEKRDFFLENSGLFELGDIPRERGPNRSIETQLLFTRRIGLSDEGKPIPILGGARLSGRAGSYNLGLLALRTRETAAIPAENFTVLRFKRDILSSSDFGALFISRDTDSSPHYNRSLGLDANLRFFQNLTVNSYLAKTQTQGIPGDDLGWKVSSQWRNNLTNLQIIYTDLDENFNPEVGFVERTGIRSTFVRTDFHPRPKENRVIREFYPHARTTYVTDQQNRLVTKVSHMGFEVIFQNGSRMELVRDGRWELLGKSFRLPANVTIPAGDYGFRAYGIEYDSDASKPFWVTLRYNDGTFWHGTKKMYLIGGSLRPHFKFSLDLRYTRNNAKLPGDSFATDLLVLRTNYSFNPRMFLSALAQYNSDTGKISSNIRFNFIHRPLSDIFLVYSEERATRAGREVDRVIAFKYTHLFDF